MLIDVFLGFDELQLASFRINYLSKFVNRTIIFESNKTHSGMIKPLYFKNWYLTLDSSYQEKISIMEINLDKFSESWDREIFSREFAMNFLRNNFQNEKFILSDIDEIPSISQVQEILTTPGLFHFKTPTYYRKINWALRDNHSNWSRGVAGEVSKAIYPNGARFTKSLPVISKNPGAHLSYLAFDAQKLEKKLLSFAHTEFTDASKDARLIIDMSDEYGLDHLGRFFSKGFGLLRVADSSENDVLVKARKYFSDEYFGKVEFKKSLPIRLYKSAVLTTFYNNSGKLRLHSLPKLLILLTILKGIAHGLRRLIFENFRK